MDLHQIRMAYGRSLRAGGVSQAFIDAFLGEEAFRNVLFEPFFEEEPITPWPPCFIPLLRCSLGIEAYGAVLHPFHPERPLSFAMLHLEGGYLDEVARSEAQFLALIALESSLGADEKVVLDDDALHLLNRLGQAQLASSIFKAASQTGILEEGLYHYVPEFRPDWPLGMYEYAPLETYTGAFPTTMTAQPSCGYERNFLVAAALVDAPYEEGFSEPSAAGLPARTPGDLWMAVQASSVSIASVRPVLEHLQTTTSHPLLGAWLQASQRMDSNY